MAVEIDNTLTGDNRYQTLISRLFVWSTIIIIVVFSVVITYVLVTNFQEQYQKNLDLLTEEVVRSKQAYTKDVIYRTIQDIEHDKISCQAEAVRLSELIGEPVADLSASLCSETMLKQRATDRIRNTRLKDEGYIWVNEVINYDGGDDYAIRRVHPNLLETEGAFLSTNAVDVKGNKPYLVELEGIKQDGELYFTYWFKKLNSDVVSQKLTFAKLYPEYNWIIATGVHLDDIENLVLDETEILRIAIIDDITRAILITLVATVAALVVAFLFRRRVEALIGYYIQQVHQREAALKALNQDLESEVEARTAEIKASEYRFRNLAKYSLQGILVHHNTKPLFLNPAYARIMGYQSVDEIMALDSIKDLIAKHEHERMQGYYQARITGQSVPNEYEIDMVRADGGLITLHQTATILDWNGRQAILLTVLDVTERKRAEAQILTERRRLTAILEGTNVGTWEWYVQTGQTIFNERWAEIVGYTLEELSPTSIDTWAKLTHPDDLVISERLLTAHINGETDYYDCETRMRHKAGYWVWVLDRGKVSEWDNQGKPYLMSGTHQEMTQRKALEESLRQAKDRAEAANRAKNTFLSSMSHELRTPLNGILGYTQILRRDETLSAEQLKGVDIIHHSGKHLLAIISDILDISKIEADRMELALAEVALQHFLRIIADLMNVRAGAKGLTFNYQPDAELPAVIYADETRLRQVLLNLLSNAVKFTAGGGVTFCINVVGQPAPAVTKTVWLRFEIIDTGMGIDLAEQTAIFEPFRQSGNRQLKQEGTGLGLSISQRLVQMMGGDLKLESSPAGSTFWFEAPFQVSDKHPPPTLNNHPKVTGYTCPGRQSPLKILIVDDWVANRETLADFLKSLGFDTIQAESGSEAIAIAGQSAPDLIFVDVVVPGMDGLETTRQIHALPNMAALPIVAMLAGITLDAQHKSLEAGCKAFLHKPFEAEAVLAVLAQCLPLAWVYPSASRSSPAAISSPQAVIITPPRANVEALLQKSQKGDMIGLQVMLETLAGENATYQPFANHLLGLIDQFDLDEIERVLHAALEKG